MSAKQQINQRIIFEEYLRECYKNYQEEISQFTNGRWSLWDDLRRDEALILQGEEMIGVGWWARNFFDRETKKLNIMDICRHLRIVYNKPQLELLFEKQDKEYFSTKAKDVNDYGKKFFDFAKAKEVELGMPKSTFKTIKDTRQRARELLHEWWSQFERVDDLANWFEGNDIMLK
jgi:hypothetical protein